MAGRSPWPSHRILPHCYRSQELCLQKTQQNEDENTCLITSCTATVTHPTTSLSYSNTNSYLQLLIRGQLYIQKLACRMKSLGIVWSKSQNVGIFAIMGNSAIIFLILLAVRDICSLVINTRGLRRNQNKTKSQNNHKTTQFLFRKILYRIFYNFKVLLTGISNCIYLRLSATISVPEHSRQRAKRICKLYIIHF